MLKLPCIYPQACLVLDFRRLLSGPRCGANPCFSMPKAELRQRIILGWQQRILETTESLRATMTGLSQSDVRLTIKALKSLPYDHQGLMRCALNGTQYTNDALFHAGVVTTDQCGFCQARDSLYHRTWDCPYFQDLRDALPALPKVDQQSQSTLCHGWLPRSPDLAKLRNGTCF